MTDLSFLDDDSFLDHQREYDKIDCPESCHVIPAHRSGVNLTIQAVACAVDELKRDLCAIDDDKQFFARTADVTLMHTLEAIQKQADRISSVCAADIRNLKARLNRKARVA